MISCLPLTRLVEKLLTAVGGGDGDGEGEGENTSLKCCKTKFLLKIEKKDLSSRILGNNHLKKSILEKLIEQSKQEQFITNK